MATDCGARWHEWRDCGRVRRERRGNPRASRVWSGGHERYPVERRLSVAEQMKILPSCPEATRIDYNLLTANFLVTQNVSHVESFRELKGIIKRSPTGT